MEGGQPAAMLGCFRGLVPQAPIQAEIPKFEPHMIKVLISIRVLNQLQVDFQR